MARAFCEPHIIQRCLRSASCVAGTGRLTTIFCCSGLDTSPGPEQTFAAAIQTDSGIAATATSNEEENCVCHHADISYFQAVSCSAVHEVIHRIHPATSRVYLTSAREFILLCFGIRYALATAIALAIAVRLLLLGYCYSIGFCSYLGYCYSLGYLPFAVLPLDIAQFQCRFGVVSPKQSSSREIIQQYDSVYLCYACAVCGSSHLAHWLENLAHQGFVLNSVQPCLGTSGRCRTCGGQWSFACFATQRSARGHRCTPWICLPVVAT